MRLSKSAASFATAPAPRGGARRLLVAVLSCNGLGAAGCAGAAPTCKIPDTVEIELESSDRVNRDEKGESLPTVIRLYQLIDLSAMQSASFDDIWERSDEVLGETKAGKPIVITIYPGQIMVQRFKRNAAADFLVGAAVFRKPIGGAWRTIDEWPLTGVSVLVGELPNQPS